MHVDPRDLQGDPPPPSSGERTTVLVFGLLVAGLFGAEVLRGLTG